MAKKCYAVRKGHRTGIVYSWDECQKMTAGFSGAEYRGFGSEEEAEAYMRGKEVATDESTGEKVQITKPSQNNEVNLYTDGSFKDGTVSFGIYLEAKERGFKFYGVVNCPQYVSINNIAGELLAVLVGVQVAKDMGYKKINIHYDQNGVEAWYSGAWTANGQLQKIYITLMNQLRLQNDLTFVFRHVKGHSGIQGNVIADQMAKRARNFRHVVDLNTILRGILTVRDVPLFG